MLSIPLEERQEKTLSNYFIQKNSVTEVAIESYTVVGNTIVYVEYNDEPSLKMVKEIGLDSLKDIPSYRLILEEPFLSELINMVIFTQ
jgi:peptide/nickel transport system permease protein